MLGVHCSRLRCVNLAQPGSPEQMNKYRFKKQTMRVSWVIAVHTCDSILSTRRWYRTATACMMQQAPLKARRCPNQPSTSMHTSAPTTHINKSHHDLASSYLNTETLVITDACPGCCCVHGQRSCLRTLAGQQYTSKAISIQPPLWCGAMLWLIVPQHKCRSYAEAGPSPTLISI